MSIFDAVQTHFNAVFGTIYLPGVFHRSVQSRVGAVLSESFVDISGVKGMTDSVTEAMRKDPGYTELDVRLIILHSGKLDQRPTSDDQYTLKGVRWSLSMISEDPAVVGWECRGSPVASP